MQGSSTKDNPFMQLNAAATKTPYLEVMKQIKKNDLWQFPVKACSLNLSLQYRDAGQGMA